MKDKNINVVYQGIHDFLAKNPELAKEFLKTPPLIPLSELKQIEEYHRLTLRLPKVLLDRVDADRKKYSGRVSRNLWIVNAITEALPKED